MCKTDVLKHITAYAQWFDRYAHGMQNLKFSCPSMRRLDGSPDVLRVMYPHNLAQNGVQLKNFLAAAPVAMLR
jgi:hypothetical protein